MKRRWQCSACTTRLCATRCRLQAGARSSTPATASWRHLSPQRARANPERPLKVRVGAAAGEPVEEHNDLFGSTVQLAARLCAHAQPEQILVSSAIAELCIGKGLSFADLGEVTLKGFGQPVRAHAAAWKQ